MASRLVDFKKRCFLILSGVTNGLGKVLAVETSRRLASSSVVLLIDDDADALQETKKEIEYLEHDIEIFCFTLSPCQEATIGIFEGALKATFEKSTDKDFEMAMILHNEGNAATHRLIEPDTPELWQNFIQKHLLAAVALNQAFLKLAQFSDIEKFVVNLRSSLLVRPLICGSLKCSSLKARDMYFRGMAAEEQRNGVSVLNYSPGILDSHKPEFDANNNMVDLMDLGVNKKLLQLSCVRPIHSTLKLINILQEMSFISGHDVDYYDTFVL